MSGRLPSAGPIQPAPARESVIAEPSGVSLVPSSPDAMSGKPFQRKVTITNPMGFHLRPLAAFARLAATFPCTVTVTKDNRRVNGKSTLELMLLAAEQGTELLIEANGPEAERALDALAEIMAAPAWDDEADRPAPPKG
jgi:phosphocarrier protein